MLHIDEFQAVAFHVAYDEPRLLGSTCSRPPSFRRAGFRVTSTSIRATTSAVPKIKLTMFLVGFTTPGAAPLGLKGAGFDFVLRAVVAAAFRSDAFAWISHRTTSQLHTVTCFRRGLATHSLALSFSLPGTPLRLAYSACICHRDTTHFVLTCCECAKQGRRAISVTPRNIYVQMTNNNR